MPLQYMYVFQLEVRRVFTNGALNSCFSMYTPFEDSKNSFATGETKQRVNDLSMGNGSQTRTSQTRTDICATTAPCLSPPAEYGNTTMEIMDMLRT